MLHGLNCSNMCRINLAQMWTCFLLLCVGKVVAFGMHTGFSTTKGRLSSELSSVVDKMPPVFQTVRAEVLPTPDSSFRRLLQISTAGDDNSVEIFQSSDGKVVRSFLPTLMLVSPKVALKDNEATLSLVEAALQWYLDCGGRPFRLQIAGHQDLKGTLLAVGFTPADAVFNEAQEYLKSHHSDYTVYNCDAKKLKSHCEGRLGEGKGDSFVLNDVMGRLAHDAGNPSEGIKFYTSALQVNPSSSAAFRNLGSAYHATGNMQLAFASYQQSIQLDPEDALVYLKLAYFYEDFATKDWVDAAEHAQSCYEYYLANVDPFDSSVLTRLGNLLVREHKSEAAVSIFQRILDLDPSLHNVWFNKAHAEIKMGDLTNAAVSLRKTLELDPTVTAARHMLRALSEEEALSASATDDHYVRDLFNSYAQVYDDHGKKLLYSAPRVIRQELAKIYRARMAPANANPPIPSPIPSPIPALDGVDGQGPSSTGSAVPAFQEATETVGSSCQTYKSFVNNSLDILDLGCGTGLAGAWLKDYASTLVGVDISSEMVAVAKKKMLYNELNVMTIGAFLGSCSRTFDVVVAADVFSYIGDLTATIQQAASMLRPEGHLVFTVEAAVDDTFLTAKGYRLLPSGRFGYSRKYIDNITESLGPQFNVTMSREFSPRLDAGDPVPGYLYIIQKTT